VEFQLGLHLGPLVAIGKAIFSVSLIPAKLIGAEISLSVAELEDIFQ